MDRWTDGAPVECTLRTPEEVVTLTVHILLYPPSPPPPLQKQQPQHCTAVANHTICSQLNKHTQGCNETQSKRKIHPQSANASFSWSPQEVNTHRAWVSFCSHISLRHVFILCDLKHKRECCVIFLSPSVSILVSYSVSFLLHAMQSLSLSHTYTCR